MMLASFTLACVLHALPFEYEVECGTKPIPGSPTLQFTITAQDGTTEWFEMSGNDNDPVVILILVFSMYDDNETDFKFRRGKAGTFYVGGTKTSPIKSLIIESDGWKPNVRRVLVVPPPKK